MTAAPLRYNQTLSGRTKVWPQRPLLLHDKTSIAGSLDTTLKVWTIL